MNYLSDAEYENYGLDPTTAQAWIGAASALINGYCRRPTLGVSQYTEQLRLTSGRNNLRLTFLPLAMGDGATSPLVSGSGRYAVPRRGEELTAWEAMCDYALAFSLPGTWVTLDVSAFDYCSETGDVSWEWNPLGLFFDEMTLSYTAGFAQIPDAVKFACAQLVRNSQATPALNVRDATLNAMHFSYFADTLLDSTVQTMLAPFVARKVG
jgi:hypothetical protein